jgi:hypothetical protein
MRPQRDIVIGKVLAGVIKNQGVKLFSFTHQSELPDRQFWESGCFATTLCVATALTLATVRALLATAAALPFATVLARAIVLARVTGGRVCARRVRAVLREGFHREARHQSGDGRRDKQCSLCSAHNFLFVEFCLETNQLHN